MVELIEQIAKVCHQANKALCEVNGDYSQLDWNEAESWQKDSARNGVIYALHNPHALPGEQHDAWCDDKLSSGWVFGEVKDSAAKTHPCLVPFEELPLFQQQKDIMFTNIVKALS